MSDKLDQTLVMKCADWAYDKAVNGITGFDSAQELAESYMNESDDLYECANSLIRWQNSKSALSGFATGFGGFATMLATLPANITSVLYVQIRMIAAIAYMGGYDLKDDKVKTLVYACLVESSGAEVLKNVGVRLGNKLAQKAIDRISRETIKQINQKVGFRLVTRFGQKGIVNLGKTIPFFGGVVGALIDGFSTNVVGNVARDTFLAK